MLIQDIKIALDWLKTPVSVLVVFKP